MHPNLQSALELAAQGLPVFPVYWMAAPGVCACRHTSFCKIGSYKHEECTPEKCKACHPGKHPITPRGLHDATLDTNRIAEWWRIAPDANVGIAVPDGLIVVDVDPRNGGVATFDALDGEHPFGPTRCASTGGGGVHLWYRLPPGRGLPSTLGPGIDIKQQGGYVLAPPSNHVSGGVYAWATASTAPIADAAPWLLGRSYDRAERALVVVDEDDERSIDDATLDRIAETVAPRLARGNMHNVCKNLAGWMKQRGYGLSDVNYVVRRLPLRNVPNGLEAAKAAFRIQRAFGWNELKTLIGDGPAAALDGVTPNPRRARELEERASANEMAQAMVAVAVPAQNSNAVGPVQGMASVVQLFAGAQQHDPWQAWAEEIDLSRDPPPMPWVCQELEIGPGRPTALMGYANSAKTPFALAIAVAVASGRPLLDTIPVTKGRVAWLAYEAARVTHGKARRIARGMGVEEFDGLKMHRMKKLLTAPGAIEAIHAYVRQGGFLMCVVDTYSSAIAGIEHNSEEFAVALRALEKISDETGTTFLVLVHSKKVQNNDLKDFAGHHTAAGAMQAIIGLTRPDPEEKFVIQVSCIRELDRPFAPFRVRFVDDAQSATEALLGGALRLSRVVEETKKEAASGIGVASEKLMAFLREHARDGSQMRWSDVVAEVSHRLQEMNAARARLAREGRIHAGGSPMMVSLIEGSLPHDPRSFAPPQPIGHSDDPAALYETQLPGPPAVPSMGVGQ